MTLWLCPVQPLYVVGISVVAEQRHAMHIRIRATDISEVAHAVAHALLYRWRSVCSGVRQIHYDDELHPNTKCTKYASALKAAITTTP
jgi:hypothetical protein